jgi:hypothetical protein
MLLRGLGLLNKLSMDVRENTTGGDGDLAQELVQLLVVSDGQLNVSRDDSLLLAFLGGVASELQNLSDHVLEDGSQVNGSTRTDPAGISAVLQESANSANRELKTSLGALGTSTSLLSSFAATTLSFSRHIIFLASNTLTYPTKLRHLTQPKIFTGWVKMQNSVNIVTANQF